MSETQQVRLGWSAPGPVADAFMRDRSPVSIINGPVGSGKTTAAIMKAVALAAAQRPSTRTSLPGPGTSELWPVRKFRLCVVRDTYRQLWRSTMQSWFKRFPRSMGVFTGAENAPAAHLLTFALADRTLVQLHVDFIAIGDQAVEDVMRGYEPTAFYLNEMDLLAREVFEHAGLRTGRFPDMDEGGPTWHGILGDCNAPVIDSWLYDQFFLASHAELRARGVALFRQPGAFDPAAENRANLPPTYYEAILANAEEWMARRMVHNLPGFDRSGKPVYGEYNDLVHVPKVDHPGVPPLRLIVGLDAGGSPAGTFKQRLPSGLWLVLSELVTSQGTGPGRFGDLLAQKLRERFPQHHEIIGSCDPSALYGADKTAGEKDWSEIVAARSGIRIVPAPTNDPIARQEAVRRPLSTLIDGRPAFQMNPECRVLRAGFNAGYRFRRVPGTSGRFGEQAEKTAESHPHDALQYGMSYGGEDVAIRQRRGEDHTRASILPSFSPPYDPYAHAAGG